MVKLSPNARALIIALIAVAVGLPAAILIGGTGDDPERSERDELDARIRGLLEERRQLLERIVTELEQQHRAGRVPPAAVLEAREARWRDALEIATTDAERLEAHRRLLSIAREAEKLLSRRFEAGTASATEAFRARAKRIEAEVALLRAKQNRQPVD